MFGKCLLLLLLLPVTTNAQVAGAIPPGDWWVVTAFGAVADGRTDNQVAIQRAIDTAAVKGGVVYIPSGQWVVKGCVRVKPGVSLIGTDLAPLSPYQLTGTVILATGGRDDENAAPLFELWNASCLKGLMVYYPDQRPDSVHPYPWTVWIRNPEVVHSLTEKRKETFDVTVEDLTLINSYNGIRCGPDENGRHRIRNINGCVLRRGILVDWVGDVGRIENVHFHSHFWFHPSTGGNWDAVFKYMQQNLEAFIFGRSDWEYVTNTFVFPARTGYKFIQTKNGSCNGQFSGIGADATQNAIVVESVQSQGLQITNGEFNSHLVGSSTQVVVEKGCEGSIRFSNCGFWGPAVHSAVIEGNSYVSFQNCYFSSNYIAPENASPNYAIVAANGKLQVDACTFDGAQTDETAQWTYKGAKKRPASILLEKSVRHAIITGNNGFGGVRVVNRIGSRAIINNNEPDGQ